ncbi:MAG: LysM peptidoglycan-binding domain-containing protein [Rectinemataceae bacterium]
MALLGLVLALLPLSLLSAAEPRLHVVSQGDTVYSVARLYGLSPSALMVANGLSEPARLKVGQKIVIPRFHRVQKGETLFGIAKAEGRTVEDLRSLNGLKAGDVLKEGQILILPSAVEAPKPATGAATQAAAPASSAASPSPVSPAASVAVPAPSHGTGPGSPARPAADLAQPAKQELSGASSGRAVTSKAPMPCEGEARYMDGKVFGIAITSMRGKPIRAVAAGTVVSAGPYRGFGSVAFVQARNGLYFVYGGGESLGVRVGDTIKTGQVLGSVGIDQLSDSPLAFFFVFKGNEALDPATAPRE